MDPFFGNVVSPIAVHSPWPLVRLRIPEIVGAVNAATICSYVEVRIPLPSKKPFYRS